MSCQPFQLTDFESRGSETSDSDEPLDPTTVELYRPVAHPPEPWMSEICVACHWHSMQRHPNNTPWRPWSDFSRIKSSAAAGRRCCSLITDAIETWLRHADRRAYNAVHLGSGPLFDTLKVLLKQCRSREERMNGRRTVNLLVDLRWQTDSINRPVCLFIFAPNGMQKHFTTDYIVPTN